jgi:hypothetical protein
MMMILPRVRAPSIPAETSGSAEFWDRHREVDQHGRAAIETPH